MNLRCAASAMPLTSSTRPWWVTDSGPEDLARHAVMARDSGSLR